jgi:hypothetical protein
MQFEIGIELIQRSTGERKSTEFGDALGEGEVNAEMLFEAVRERVWRCNWRARLSELRDALGSRDKVNLEMHFEAVIV